MSENGEERGTERTEAKGGEGRGGRENVLCTFLSDIRDDEYYFDAFERGSRAKL
jgi:hypothetical protein